MHVYKKHLMVKLSPNVTNIQEIALAVESEGADSVSLINTLLGMAIDAKKRKPVLSTITGGLSGACVKPIALRMVWQVAKAVKIPVVGLGRNHVCDRCYRIFIGRRFCCSNRNR